MLYVFIFYFHISLADDNAPSKQLVSSEEESKALPAAEDVSGATAASSSTPEYVFRSYPKGFCVHNIKKLSFSTCVLNNCLCDCTERVFAPVCSVTVWSGACTDRGN